MTIVGIGGESDDFLGQYNRNSHVELTPSVQLLKVSGVKSGVWQT